jgi:hypothetical protein
MFVSTVQENTPGGPAVNQTSPKPNSPSKAMANPNHPDHLRNLPISTPIRVNMFSKLLGGYDKDLASFLISGFTFVNTTQVS